MKKSIKRSKGMATLLITVIVLMMMTTMVIFATKVGVFDQKMVGNEARYKEAFSTAEAGLDLAVQRFDNQFRAASTVDLGGTGTGTPIATIVTNSAIAAGTNTAGGVAATGTPSFGVTVTDSGSALVGFPVYDLVSTGTGADGTGTATIRRQISMRQALGGSAPDVPIVVSGSVGTGGNFNIVANPNGAGSGIPLAIWTPGPSPAGDVSMDGSSATCQLEFMDGNNPQCSNPSGNSELLSQGDGSTATAYTTNFPDVLPNDPNFPADLFKYLFGVPRAEWAAIKSQAAGYGQVVADCSSLDANSGSDHILWWVTGDCNMGSNQIIGSTAKPIILVIDDHEFDMGGGNARLYGMLFIFDNPSDVATPSTDFHGGPAIYGALVSDVGGAAMNGSYSIVYDSELLGNLSGNGNTSSYDMAYIPGSWRDF